MMRILDRTGIHHVSGMFIYAFKDQIFIKAFNLKLMYMLP